MSGKDIALRVPAAIFAVVWLVPEFGAIDMIAAWWPDWPRMLEAGWGAFVTFLIAVPFVVLVFRPRLRIAYLQLIVVGLVLAVSAAAALEPQLLGLLAVLVVQLAILVALARPSLELPPTRPSPWLLALAAAGCGPWLVYASRMWAADRAGDLGDITNGVEHYAVQGALGLALALLPLVAAVTQRSLPLPSLTGAAAAVYLGVVSLAAPGAAGGFSAGWSIAAVTWGAALAALVFPRLRSLLPGEVSIVSAFGRSGPGVEPSQRGAATPDGF